MSMLGDLKLGFGGACLSGEGGGYGFGQMSESSAQELIEFSWEQGLRLYDTAPIYGFGLSELRLGKYLPQDAYVITKGGVDWHENKRVNMTNSPEVIEKMIHASLKRLNRPISMYMIHWPDPLVDIRRPLEVIKKFQDQGDIKEIGLCNSNSNDLSLAKEICTIVGLQSEVNLFNPSQLDFRTPELLTMSWGSFDKGILTARVRPERKYEETDARSWAPWWNKKEVAIKVSRVDALKEILKNYEIELAHFALQFIICEKEIRFPLVGAKTTDDLKSAIFYSQKTIPRKTIQEIYSKWIQL